MIRFLLDTNVISEAIKAVPNKAVMRKLEVHQKEIATASPVWHELQFGCYRLPVSRKRSILEAFLLDVVRPGMAILPYDEVAAQWHADQRARLNTIGRPPSFVDGQIAAIAKVNQLILVTRNVADYADFSKLDLQNWHE
ncbi:type II toxin-antitoxin system VapC family toxin [uncultured Desulfosarcina sp.]|uniref:type II toxin-antitoxin system VapC family toxin n=1 Tax=uncultured Desulfosarcina sp. TaxID=218289 RepID=UPI0029C97338|nr:type II toxin-antitoxin system VapC family toxin [uncultured Desulfosarcina sp.]